MRSLRVAAEDDTPTLAAMLRAEGLADADMAFTTSPTFVLEEDGIVMGFFTLALALDVPHLVHLVVGRAHRSPARARFLGRALRTIVRDAGFATMIVHACTAPVREIVAYYFRAWPYATVDGRTYYLVAA